MLNKIFEKWYNLKAVINLDIMENRVISTGNVIYNIRWDRIRPNFVIRADIKGVLHP